LRYRIFDAEGKLLGKAGSLRKAEELATYHEKKHGYKVIDLTQCRYCVVEPVMGAS
jgi:hypothetical protein